MKGKSGMTDDPPPTEIEERTETRRKFLKSASPDIS
jgi:hypothetical protein